MSDGNQCRQFKKARSANSSSANFPTWVSAEIDPSFADIGTAAGRCLEKLIVDSGGFGGIVNQAMVIMPYGLGSDNDVFDMKIVGYRRVQPQLTDGRTMYTRSLLGHFTCTLSAAVGLAASGGVNPPILSTERFVDTIAVVKEITWTADTTREGSTAIFSPANDSPGYLVLPTLGCEGYEIEWDQTTGTPTMNALISFIDSPSKHP